MKTLSELVKETAQSEWAQETSLSYKNQRSIPVSARNGFALCADMGGVCLLDPSGRFRVFSHSNQEELDVTDMVRRVGTRALSKKYPHIAALMDGLS